MYHYRNGKLGMTQSGSFTKDRTRWILFSQAEADRIANAKPQPGRKVARPYGATHQGQFVPVDHD